MSSLYAVIGNPIGHSKSPSIHGAFAAETGQDLRYVAIEGRPGAFAEDVDAFRARGGLGLNITAPFKLDAFRYAGTLSEPARLAGAVNCLSFDGDGVAGYNFDGVGLLKDIEQNLSQPLRARRVLMLGAGGAARGALLPFLAARPAELVLVNRTPSKAEELATSASSAGPVRVSDYVRLADEAPFDVVVNATSASLRGELPPLPAGTLRGARLAYELAYGKGLTPFLRRARDEAAGQLADGVGMLVEQAAEAFALWRGVRPDTQAVIERMTIPLT